MTTYTRIEKRERSPLGKLIKWVFIGFNVLMLVWLVGGTNAALQTAPMSGAGRAGAMIGTSLGAGLIIVLWALGDIILGMFVLLTRGDKVLVEERSRESVPSNLTGNSGNADATIARMLQERTGTPAQAPSTSPAGFGKRR